MDFNFFKMFAWTGLCIEGAVWVLGLWPLYFPQIINRICNINVVLIMFSFASIDVISIKTYRNFVTQFRIYIIVYRLFSLWSSPQLFEKGFVFFFCFKSHSEYSRFRCSSRTSWQSAYFLDKALVESEWLPSQITILLFHSARRKMWWIHSAFSIEPLLFKKQSCNGKTFPFKSQQ